MVSSNPGRAHQIRPRQLAVLVPAGIGVLVEDMEDEAEQQRRLLRERARPWGKHRVGLQGMRFD